MGLFERPTPHVEKQAAGRRKRPRARRCLLKGCGQCFHPRQAHQRYCGQQCRRQARRWSRWKAQQNYRSTTAGKEKRNGQSRSYRQRARNRKRAANEAIAEAARVITPEDFFRSLLRPARLLRVLRAPAAARWNWCCSGSGGGNKRGIKPCILIGGLDWPYIQHVRCNWNFTNSTGAGNTCECAPRTTSGG